MFKARAILIAFFISALLVSCSQVAEVPQLESAATNIYTEVEWNKGEPSKSLIATDQGFCYLAGIQGNFRWANDQVSVFTLQGKYGLYGTNTEWAKAICVHWSALETSNDAFQPVRWVSDEFSSKGNCWNTKGIDTWWGDAVTYLTGLGGNLAARGGVFVKQSHLGDQPSKLGAFNVHTCDESSEVYARGRSMFFGEPHIYDMPLFWGPDGQGVTFSSAGEYVADSRPNSLYKATVEMAPTDQAFCYLKNVHGRYNHTGDWAWIYRNVNAAGKEVWMLNVRDANPVDDDTYVSAHAACYMLEQN